MVKVIQDVESQDFHFSFKLVVSPVVLYPKARKLPGRKRLTPMMGDPSPHHWRFALHASNNQTLSRKGVVQDEKTVVIGGQRTVLCH